METLPTIDKEALAIVRLFLEKLELLTPLERMTISKTIDLLNYPVFVAPQE